MNLCGSRNVPFRPGRIDAVAADPTTGVPKPESDLDTTLSFFARSGLNKADAIGLTACGHTMGSVHAGGFPNVVPNNSETVTPHNTNGGVNFDTTRGQFDSRLVKEYVEWTGQRGGALVTTDNVTTRSDLRLYESDGNSTMQALYAKGDGFLDTCVDLMSRMINTVPTAVKLGNPIEAMHVKPVNVSYDFDETDQLILSGNIRVGLILGNMRHKVISANLMVTDFDCRW